jgi:hypothetical protein
VLAVQAAFRAKQLYSQVRSLVLESPRAAHQRAVLPAHFNVELWPLIESLRNADLSICRFEAIKGAKPMIYWQRPGSADRLKIKGKDKQRTLDDLERLKANRTDH